MSQEKLVAQYFKENKSVKEIHITSDGFIFPQRKHALDHANTLEDSKSEVETVKNPNHIESDTDQTVQGNTQLNEEQKELLVSGLKNENYNAIKALVKVLNIETPDQKVETLIKALEDYKSNNPID